MHLENEGSRAAAGYKWARKLCLILLQTPSSLLWTFISPPSGDTAFYQVQAKKNPYRQSVKSTTSLESQRTKQSKLGQILIEWNLLMQGAFCLRPDASCALNLNHEPNAITHLSMIWAFLMLDHQLCQLNLCSTQMRQSWPKDWLTFRKKVVLLGIRFNQAVFIVNWYLQGGSRQ